jgi:hypothetical protein
MYNSLDSRAAREQLVHALHEDIGNKPKLTVYTERRASETGRAVQLVRRRGWGPSARGARAKVQNGPCVPILGVQA